MSINPIYNANYVQAPNLKSKKNNEPESVTTPVPSPELTFRGTEALRAYNYNIVNKNDFDIPELEPICQLEDMDKIQGERIYNSDGELVQIVDNKDDCKIIYTPSSEDKNIFDIEVFKDDKMIKQQHFYKSIDGNTYLYIHSLNNDKDSDCTMAYKYDNGKLSKFRKSKDIKDKALCYWYEKKEYELYDGDVKKLYNQNLKLKQTIDFSKDNQNTRTNYWNDKAVSTETRTYENKNLQEQGGNPFDDKDLIPAEYYEIGDTKNVQGKKYYYSNGQVEKIVTEEGKTYFYNLNGEFDYLKFNNKEISKWADSIVIEEDIGNDKTKITYFDGKEPTTIRYFDGDKEKSINMNNNGEITYQECNDGYSVLQKTYDKDKNLLNQWVWYHDNNDY